MEQYVCASNFFPLKRYEMGSTSRDCLTAQPFAPQTPVTKSPPHPLKQSVIFYCFCLPTQMTVIFSVLYSLPISSSSKNPHSLATHSNSYLSWPYLNTAPSFSPASIPQTEQKISHPTNQISLFSPTQFAFFPFFSLANNHVAYKMKVCSISTFSIFLNNSSFSHVFFWILSSIDKMLNWLFFWFTKNSLLFKFL